MNPQKTSPARTAFCAVGVFALLTLILGTVTALTCWDTGSDYFLRGKALPGLAVAAAILTALLGSAAAFFAWETRDPFDGGIEIPVSAIGFLTSGIILLTTAGTLAKAAGIILILGAFYPILIALPGLKDRRITPASGFLTVISFLLLNVYYYFDKGMEMNAPVKSVLEMFLICAALWYVEGLRYQLGNPAPRAHLMLGAWTAAAALLAGIPVILSYTGGDMTRKDYLAGGILAAAVLTDTVIRTVKALRSN